MTRDLGYWFRRAADDSDRPPPLPSSELLARAQRGVRRRRRHIAATTGLIAAAVVIVGAAIGAAVRQEASPDPSSPAPSSGCEIPDQWTPAIEAGVLTEQQACRELQPGEQDIPASYRAHFREGPYPDNPILIIHRWPPPEEWIADCRTGNLPNRAYEAAQLACNALLKIAAGELEPTHICEPPQCSKPKLVWAYGPDQLRNLAQDD